MTRRVLIYGLLPNTCCIAQIMISAGYMFKKVVDRPSWIKNEAVKRIYSVSSCCSDDFSEYINYWKHNGYWLFNKPADMEEIILKEKADRSALSLFYYEVFEKEYDPDDGTWETFKAEDSFTTDVSKPESAELQGFDVVTFQMGTNPECSLLSCNSFADHFEVNEYCLFETFSSAKTAIESGVFETGEPGPFRIFAVYLV